MKKQLILMLALITITMSYFLLQAQISNTQFQADSIIDDIDIDNFQLAPPVVRRDIQTSDVDVDINNLKQDMPVTKTLSRNIETNEVEIYNVSTKSMIGIKSCLHVVYNKQFSRPTCLKSL